MSVAPPACGDCGQEAVFDRVVPFPSGQETNYAVSWRCPLCGTLSLDVCPIGPLVPGPDVCFNCGEAIGDAGEFCPACGLTPGQAEAAYGSSAAEAELLSAARDAFGRGLFRRGHGLLNSLLRRNVGGLAAWQMKIAFLDALHFNKAKRALLEQALAKGAPFVLRIPYGKLLAVEELHAEAVAAFRAFLATAPAPEHAAVAKAEMARSLAALGDASAVKAP
jgi:hypothetical protein